MPDSRLMVAFTEAVGPVDPSDREAAPEALKERLGVADQPPERDFYGLDMTVRYLRSEDGGLHWNLVRADPFKALYPASYGANATIALRDGTLLRRVNGWDLMQEDLPRTAYLQRLAPGASDWSAPEVLMDPKRYTYQLSRLRRLRDGCLIALGQVWDAPAGSPASTLNEADVEYLMLVSADDGRTWRRNPIALPEDSYLEPNEWDAAELPDGNLLALFRTRESSTSREPVRRQGLLAWEGTGWKLTDVTDAPMPHSGHPDLLATREGPVLSLSTTGVLMTEDGGRSWQPLKVAGGGTYATEYYPRSVQAEDGAIHVFAHRGSDSGYGEVPNQMIVGDTFRLQAADGNETP